MNAGIIFVNTYIPCLKAILRLNANNTQTKVTKTKEMVTGSQDGLIIRGIVSC